MQLMHKIGTSCIGCFIAFASLVVIRQAHCWLRCLPRTVLHVAVQSGNLAAVQRLLENSEHALVKRNGYREVRQNPNVNAQDNMGYTPLHIAAMNGDANIATGKGHVFVSDCLIMSSMRLFA
jgi:hypothetical protein